MANTGEAEMRLDLQSPSAGHSRQKPRTTKKTTTITTAPTSCSDLLWTTPSASTPLPTPTTSNDAKRADVVQYLLPQRRWSCQLLGVGGCAKNNNSKRVEHLNCNSSLLLRIQGSDFFDVIFLSCPVAVSYVSSWWRCNSLWSLTILNAEKQLFAK